MRNPAQRYVEYRNKFGLSHKEAAKLSGFSFVRSIRQSLFWIVVLLALLVWVRMDHNDKMAEQAGYTKTLETIVNGCTDPKGTTLVIGDRIFLCKTYDTGAQI